MLSCKIHSWCGRFGSLAAVSAALALLLAPGAEAQVQPPPQPLAGIAKKRAKLTFPQSIVDGEVSYDMSGRTLTIEWAATFTPGAPTDPHLSLQTESLSFWPTEVAGLGPGRLAVAGKHPRTGNTVIEVWEFALPSPFPAPYLNPASGELVYPDIRIPIASRKQVFDEETSGKSLVWAMFPHHGKSGCLLVQFWDSRDLYSLDTATEALTLVLTPSATGLAPQESNLANPYTDRWSARHAVHGYVYFFSPGGEKSHDLLALFDRDLDGQIEEHRTVTRQEFHQLGLSDGSAYLGHY